MSENYIKMFALNTVQTINADRNKPKKADIINRISRMFGDKDREIFYSVETVEAEINRLIETGQIVIKPDGLAVFGVGIFEEAKPVSFEGNELSKIIFQQLENTSEFSPTTKTMDGYIIEEMINSMAVIVDTNISKRSRKISEEKISPKAKNLSKAIFKELGNRRGFRQPMDGMRKKDINHMIDSMAQIIDKHFLKAKLDNDLSLKQQIKSPKI